MGCKMLIIDNIKIYIFVIKTKQKSYFLLRLKFILARNLLFSHNKNKLQADTVSYLKYTPQPYVVGTRAKLLVFCLLFYSRRLGDKSSTEKEVLAIVPF